MDENKETIFEDLNGIQKSLNDLLNSVYDKNSEYYYVEVINKATETRTKDGYVKEY